MDPAVIIILIVVALVLLGYLLRFSINGLINRGTDAIANKRRQTRNETNGPEVVRLADMYPQIALMHYQNGTATPAPELKAMPEQGAQPAAAMPAMQAAAPAMQAAPMVQAMPGTQTAAMPYAQMPGAMPYGYYPMPAQPKVHTGAGMKITAAVVTGIGLLINLIVLFFFRWSFLADETPEGLDEAFGIRIARGTLLLTVAAILAYLVLLIVRNARHTLFFPILSSVIGISILVLTFRYKSAWEETHSGRVLDKVNLAVDGAVLLVLASLLVLACFVLYVWKDVRWVLWIGLILGTGATICAGLAIGGIGYTFSASIWTLGNYFGYSLAVLLYAFAYRKKEAVAAA
ncbi:MAG: hypothetical protein J5738_01290 [Lachnospiraceae bacterium]|nr:hypothetical protein [Lachnospiraceae bacterium]